MESEAFEECTLSVVAIQCYSTAIEKSIQHMGQKQQENKSISYL